MCPHMLGKLENLYPAGRRRWSTLAPGHLDYLVAEELLCLARMATDIAFADLAKSLLPKTFRPTLCTMENA
jgi:hypothetical protein